MLILLLFACSESAPPPPSQPEVKVERALDAYDQALVDHRDQDWEAALVSIDTAIERDPQSPALYLWKVQILLDAGQAIRARSILDDAVRLFPENDDVLYNRAALRGRNGDIGGAADDLRRLKVMGLLDPRETGSDPDFVGLRDDPLFGELVMPPQISLSVKGEEGSVLLGEPWELEITLSVPSKGTLELRWANEPSDLIQLESVVEQEVRDTLRERTLELRIRWRAVQAGEGVVGPWTLHLDSAEAVIDAIPLKIASLGKEKPVPLPVESQEIPLPKTMIEAIDERGLSQLGQWAAVGLHTGETIQTVPSREPILLEWRSSNGTVERAEAFEWSEGLRVERMKRGQLEWSFQLQ